MSWPASRRCGTRCGRVVGAAPAPARYAEDEHRAPHAAVARGSGRARRRAGAVRAAAGAASRRCCSRKKASGASSGREKQGLRPRAAALRRAPARLARSLRSERGDAARRSRWSATCRIRITRMCSGRTLARCAGGAHPPCCRAQSRVRGAARVDFVELGLAAQRALGGRMRRRSCCSRSTGELRICSSMSSKTRRKSQRACSSC